MSYNNVNYFFSNFENIGYFCEASGFEFEMKYVKLLAPSYIGCWLKSENIQLDLIGGVIIH